VQATAANTGVFNIYGFDFLSGSSFQTSSGDSYTMSMIVDDDLINGLAGNGVSLSSDSENIDNATLLITFLFINENSVDATISLIIKADVNFRGNEYAPVSSLPAWSGFAIGPVSGVQFNFVCRNSDLVTDMDSFWVGSATHRHGQ
jgi:hypothetical protein